MFKCSRRYAFTQAQRRSLVRTMLAALLAPFHKQSSQRRSSAVRRLFLEPGPNGQLLAVNSSSITRSCCACLPDGPVADRRCGEAALTAHVRCKVLYRVDEA